MKNMSRTTWHLTGKHSTHAEYSVVDTSGPCLVSKNIGGTLNKPYPNLAKAHYRTRPNFAGKE